MFILYGSIIIFLYLLSNFDDLASLSFLYHRPSPLPPLPYFLCHCLLPLMVCHILHSIISPLSFFTLFYLFISLSLSLSFSLLLSSSLSLSPMHTHSLFLFFSGMLVHPNHQHVDREGCVFTPYIASWQSASSLCELLTVLSSIFSNDPPLFTR